MEAEKADVIISCFITLSGPLCNLPCKALTAGFSTSAKHLSKWIKYTEKYLWSFPGRACPGSRSRAEKLPVGHRSLHFIHFLRGVVNAEISWFFFRVLFWLGFWGFFLFCFFLPLSVRDGGGGNAHLYLNRDLFFSIRFFFPLFFFFLLLFSTRFCWPVWRTLLCLHWKTQRSKHRLPLPRAPWVCM